ncbi:hypothetical protein TRFO_01895 [Tritrichomonas foetus]|uniref:Uncharacterized protein n=1 Tax=Tritrichomonas foetus TaxID=1144522 RepID=A0A1J4JI16_9EUKA|nr:hypothetical protein TRFO_01895 [Tritrichomonas foetus]|eukprot:OHS98824.1 hypothetical protein TRFO_01895 [Tritrichomonas foetus]
MTDSSPTLSPTSSQNSYCNPEDLDHYIQIMGFANLIMREVDKRQNPHERKPVLNQAKIKQTCSLPKYRRIRCICGCDESDDIRKLIECPLCHCFLHIECIKKIGMTNKNFKCPFCQLISNGKDQFCLLKEYIQNVQNEYKKIHDLLKKAKNYENDFIGQLNDPEASPNHFEAHTKIKGIMKKVLTHFDAFLDPAAFSGAPKEPNDENDQKEIDNQNNENESGSENE